jgi:hypothetical protein
MASTREPLLTPGKSGYRTSAVEAVKKPSEFHSCKKNSVP